MKTRKRENADTTRAKRRKPKELILTPGKPLCLGTEGDLPPYVEIARIASITQLAGFRIIEVSDETDLRYPNLPDDCITNYKLRDDELLGALQPLDRMLTLTLDRLVIPHGAELALATPFARLNVGRIELGGVLRVARFTVIDCLELLAGSGIIDGRGQQGISAPQQCTRPSGPKPKAPDGANGTVTHPDGRSGLWGEPGSPGARGENGGRGEDGHQMVLSVGGPLPSGLVLDFRGGDGGLGQPGCPGGDGGHGGDGGKAIGMGFKGGIGGTGGKGGTGGAGGEGGLGGNGGYLEISYQGGTSLEIRILVGGGSGARGGLGGSGGNGGRPGSGGRNGPWRGGQAPAGATGPAGETGASGPDHQQEWGRTGVAILHR